MHNVILSPISTDDLIQRIAKATAEMMRGYSSNESQPIDDLPLSIDEVASLIGKTKPTIYGYVSRNEIPHSKSGGRLYFFKSQIIEWIKEGQQKTFKELEAEAVLPIKKRAV